MSILKKAFIIVAATAALAACETKKPDTAGQADAASTAEEKPSEEAPSEEAPTAEAGEAEIPEELKKQAEQEITAENAEQAAAELEKEIEADLQ
jgi:hypothetical protein